MVDVVRGFEVAQKIEEKGAVLLKNDHGQLPLNAAGIRSIAVIGGHADVGVMSGGGSAPGIAGWGQRSSAIAWRRTR